MNKTFTLSALLVASFTLSACSPSLSKEERFNICKESRQKVFEVAFAYHDEKSRDRALRTRLETVAESHNLELSDIEDICEINLEK